MQRKVSEASGEGAGNRVLVAGVYLADCENSAAAIAMKMRQSQKWQVEQKWIALGRAPIPEELEKVTVWRAEQPLPKFVLLNRLFLECALNRYAFVLICDDDIDLPAAFVDRYLDRVATYDLALAQPARTHDSYVGHTIVERLDGLDARRTRFVEIGPLFSMARKAYQYLLPFDESSPMGWGYDYVWPVVIQEMGFRMGIVDATPVAHRFRKPVTNYSFEEARAAMRALLARRPHLSKHEAFSILEAYS